MSMTPNLFATRIGWSTSDIRYKHVFALTLESTFTNSLELYSATASRAFWYPAKQVKINFSHYRTNVTSMFKLSNENICLLIKKFDNLSYKIYKCIY